jgi:hypothetical protein
MYHSTRWGTFDIIDGWIKFPYSFAAVVAAAIAATAWIPFRFSLRTLLVGMTIAALALGMVILTK